MLNRVRACAAIWPPNLLSGRRCTLPTTCASKPREYVLSLPGSRPLQPPSKHVCCGAARPQSAREHYSLGLSAGWSVNVHRRHDKAKFGWPDGRSQRAHPVSASGRPASRRPGDQLETNLQRQLLHLSSPARLSPVGAPATAAPFLLPGKRSTAIDGRSVSGKRRAIIPTAAAIRRNASQGIPGTKAMIASTPHAIHNVFRRRELILSSSPSWPDEEARK